MRFSGLRNREIAVNASISENDRTTKLSVRNGPAGSCSGFVFVLRCRGRGVGGQRGGGVKGLGKGRLFAEILAVGIRFV